MKATSKESVAGKILFVLLSALPDKKKPFSGLSTGRRTDNTCGIKQIYRIRK
jgi:hypothetical protein